jgi:hypothetical protein
MCQRQPGQRLPTDEPGRSQVRGDLRRDGAGEDGVQQGGVDEPPLIWPTVTIAAATPTSCRATPKVPVLIAGA